jgi:hypothetical protein
MAVRRFFWNFTQAFVGLPILKMVPKNLVIYPVGLGVPIYTFMVLQGGNNNIF